MNLHSPKSLVAGFLVVTLLSLGELSRVEAEVANISTLAYFTGSTGSGANGAKPYAGLEIGGDGNFYGTTHQGGTNGLPFGYGTVFKLTPGGSITTIVSFNNSNGAQPYSALTCVPNGELYGTTLIGGLNNLGTIFRVTLSGNLTPLLSCTTANGAKPSGRLALGRDGYLYGTTQLGGTSNLGTVFRITTNGVFNPLVFFAGPNGAKPYAGVIQGWDGSYYGTTFSGGASNLGTIFKVTTNGSLTTLVSFSGADGANPYGGLVQDPSGILFGSTAYGGTFNLGTLYQVTTNGILTTLHSFTGGADGANPWATLLRGKNGDYYGTAILGGEATSLPRGIAFQFLTNGVFTSLASFGFNTNGGSPYGSLVQDAAGDLYGTTFDQGVGLKGTVFKLTPGRASLQSLPANGAIQIGWASWLGRAYQIQYKTNLAQTEWLDLGGVIIATNGAMNVSDPILGGARCYRVKQISTP